MEGRAMKTEVDSFANCKSRGFLHSLKISSQYLIAWKKGYKNVNNFMSTLL